MTHTAHRVLRKMKNTFAPSLLAMALGATVLLPINAEAGCNADCAFRRVGKSVNKTADRGIRFASDRARQLATLSESEYNTARNGVNQVANDATAATAGLYDKALATVSAAMTEEMLRIFRKAARDALQKNQNVIQQIAGKTKNLSDDARAALKRIVTAIPQKVVTQDMMRDMKLLGKELGLGFQDGGTGALNSIVNSSWGIGINSDFGLGPGGIGSGMALVMNVRPEADGSVKSAILASSGFAAGLDLGTAMSVQIFWQPGEVSDSNGVSIGVNAELALVEGGGVGASWPLSFDINDYNSVRNFVSNQVQSRVPSLSIGVDIPGTVITEGKGTFDVGIGLTQIVTQFKMPAP